MYKHLLYSTLQNSISASWRSHAFSVTSAFWLTFYLFTTKPVVTTEYQAQGKNTRSQMGHSTRVLCKNCIGSPHKITTHPSLTLPKQIVLKFAIQGWEKYGALKRSKITKTNRTDTHSPFPSRPCTRGQHRTPASKNGCALARRLRVRVPVRPPPVKFEN